MHLIHEDAIVATAVTPVQSIPLTNQIRGANSSTRRSTRRSFISSPIKFVVLIAVLVARANTVAISNGVPGRLVKKKLRVRAMKITRKPDRETARYIMHWSSM